MTDIVQDLFSRRLKLLRERKSVTMVELAEAIGRSQATISEWEKGNKFPRSGALQQLATYFNVPMDFFFKEESFPFVDMVSIPLFPSISAGAHSIVEGKNDDEIELINLPTLFFGKYLKGENLMAFFVNGDSMDMIFPHGATIVAKQVRQEDVKNDDIVIYRFDNEYAVKRYRRNERQKVIVFSPESTNKSYHDIVIPFSTQQNLGIIAKVIWYGVSV